MASSVFFFHPGMIANFDLLNIGVLVIHQDQSILYMNHWIRSRLPAEIKNATQLKQLFVQHDPRNLLWRIEHVFQYQHVQLLSPAMHPWVIPLVDQKFPDQLMRQRGLIQPVLLKREEPSQEQLAVLIQIHDVSDLLLQVGLLKESVTTQKMKEDQIERLNQELEQQVESLDLSNKELDEFAYIVSHDLKEPLRGIHLQTRFLMEDYEDILDEEGKKRLKRLQHLSQTMTDLMDALLSYSRAGRDGLILQNTDLNEVFNGVQDRLHEVLVEQQVEIRLPQPLPHITCDAVRVGELFHNLISNAVKYNDKPEKWVEIGYEEGRFDSRTQTPIPTFYVKDNGIGIRDDHFDLIFRIFKRLHAKDQFGGGTGAGLNFVEKIVKRHGGKIWVESSVGQGSTFYFTLQHGE